MTAPAAPATIDAYIASFPAEVRTILHKVRRAARTAAPNAREIISYRMPALRQHGVLVYFAAFKKHIGFYPPIKATRNSRKRLPVMPETKAICASR
jgi:uncharacterized protein YdhG (YjbR/CyaY superfamily)